MNNFERIKSFNIDEMIEFFTQEYDSDFTDGYRHPTICYDCKNCTQCDKFKENLKKWLLFEND